MATEEMLEELASNVRLAQFELEECAKMASAYVDLIGSKDKLADEQQKDDMLYIDREGLTATYLLLHNYVVRAQNNLVDFSRLLPKAD